MIAVNKSVEAAEHTGSCVGVCLDPAAAQVAACSGDDAPQSTVAPDSAASSIPPAVLVPRFAGEPVRAETAWPPHPRGTGEAWPPEARVQDGVEPGRFPVGYAWPMLGGAGQWTWRHESGQASVAPAVAIATVFAALIHRHAVNERPGPHVLVTPDHLTCAARQELLDAAQRLGAPIKLLWRCAAAATTWCESFADELISHSSEQDAPIGTVLALHLGLDEWELAAVDVVRRQQDGQPCLIPVRRRPLGPPLRSYGLEMMHRLARRSLELSYQQITAARVWELLWCTPWMTSALALLCGKDADVSTHVAALAPHVKTREFLKQQCRQATQQIFGPTSEVPGLIGKHLGPAPDAARLRDWCDGFRRALGDRFTNRAASGAAAAAGRLLGAIVTGPMAAIVEDRQPLALQYINRIWPQARNVLVEGLDMPAGVLARSAARYAACLALNADQRRHAWSPTFFDTLPRIRMAVAQHGQPGWVDLLAGDDSPPIAAGRPWRRSDSLPPLVIAPDTPAVRIALWHEDHATVHVASARLPHRLDAAEKATLTVTMEPAAGQPAIELRPDAPTLFGRHRIWFDLRAMKDTTLAPQKYLGQLVK